MNRTSDPALAERARPTDWTSADLSTRIRRRYLRERIFKASGLLALLIAGGFLLALLGTIVLQGVPGFFHTELRLEVSFAEDVLDRDGDGTVDEDELLRADYGRLIREALMARFPEVQSRSEIRALTAVVSSGARQELREMVRTSPALMGTTQAVWLTADDDVDQLIKGHIDRDLPQEERVVTDQTIAWIDQFAAAGDLRTGFNWNFFTTGASREAEQAGIGGAVVGSFLTLAVTLLVAFPIGLLAAIYLEEFAPRSRWTDLIEVNINNLAAVPSIVFGLLGLAVFLGTFNLPRSAPLVGGLTLALMTLPTIIIASRAAIQAVPPSLRDAARGLGASPMQVVFHHVVPVAMPGILTGTIIGMAQALGETAPLLMIGMVAFIVDIPGGFTDPATVLPVQIFMWADFPERGFVEKTSAAIMVLLAFLVAMNAAAVWLRNRFEKRW